MKPILNKEKRRSVPDNEPRHEDIASSSELSVTADTTIEGCDVNSNRGVYVNQGLTCSSSGEVSEKVGNDIRVLGLIVEPGQTYSQKDISEKLGICRQTVRNNIRKMESKGLVKSISMGVFMFYEVTDKGREYYLDHDVNPVHRGMKPMVRIHDYRLIGDVNQPLPTNHMGEWRVFMPRGPKGWKGYTRGYSDDDIGTVTVNITSKSGILYFSIVKANSLDEAEAKLFKAVGWIIEKLACEGIFITNLHQEKEGSYARVYDPTAKKCFDHKITYSGSSFSIDHSHGHPEIEFSGKERLEQYLKLTDDVLSGRIAPDKSVEMRDA